MSPAKKNQLKAIWQARRDVPVNDPGVTNHELRGILADIHTILRDPEPGVRSIRRLADECKVSDKTVRRWLAGEDTPPSTAVRVMQQWARKHAR